MRTEPRFVVREVVGYAQPSTGSNTMGASYCVLDAWINFRNVGEYRSETRVGRADGGDGRRTLGFDGARALADARAAELNAAYQREVVSSDTGTAA